MNEVVGARGAVLLRSLFVVFAAVLVMTADAQNLFHSGLFYETVVSGLDRPTAFEFVGDETILVNEKLTGQVQVVRNGALAGIALDLSVANAAEMGLLGIVRHPDFEENHLVYLYYTYAAVDGGTLIEDRVEAYEWKSTNSTLNFRASIAKWPGDGWPISPYHHGGYMKIGPDRKLYIQHGDMRRYGTMETNQNTGVSGSNAAIYRLELDGSVPLDNPFVSNPHLNFRRAFVYGVRNAFGMAFDPISGKLWYTENGPEIYDEINVAEPGMNSGWSKIMGPDYRDAEMVINNGKSFNQKDLFFIPGSHYSDPVFSYLTPIGITCIEFLWNTKFPDSIRPMAVMSCTSVGRIFLLPVEPDRTSLTLRRSLADGVADTVEERDEFMLGNGWGAITDARVGPDGYLYVNAYASGTIYRIRPKQEWVVADHLAVLRGNVQGALEDTQESDNLYLTVQPGAVLSSSQAPAVLELESTSPFESIRDLKFSVEVSGSSTAIFANLQLYDFEKEQYRDLGGSFLTIEDGLIEVSVIEGSNVFVEPITKRVRSRISFKAAGPVLQFPWSSKIDRVFWTMTRS